MPFTQQFGRGMPIDIPGPTSLGTPAGVLTEMERYRQTYHRGANWLYDRSRVARNLMDWGLKGVGESALRGAASAVGFSKTAEGAYRFLGGAKALPMGLGFGAGMLAYAATDSPLIGAGVGFGTAALSYRKAAGGLWGGAKLAGRGLAPLFTLASMYEGYKQGGIGGALGAGAKSAAEFALIDVGFGAVTTAFKGTGIGKFTGVALKAAVPVGIALAVGYGAYKGATAIARYGKRTTRSEFVGSMEAFNTQAGYTMRQRALQEIGRSHTNARTVLGNEAVLMHM